jgi:hypothetical protein
VSGSPAVRRLRGEGSSDASVEGGSGAPMGDGRRGAGGGGRSKQGEEVGEWGRMKKT